MENQGHLIVALIYLNPSVKRGGFHRPVCLIYWWYSWPNASHTPDSWSETCTEFHGNQISVTFCVTLAASMAARKGPTTMAAFKVWLATSLLADGLAVAGQAIIASAFAKMDYEKVTATASRVLQLGLVLGLVLAVFLGVGL